MKSERSFTLIELLIVVGILATLATVAMFIINPIQLMAQARDSRRLAELQDLNKAFLMAQIYGASFGSSKTIYTSLPDDSSPTCGSYSLPAIPTGWTYSCASSSKYMKIDGNGWIPVNFNSLPIVSPLSALPIDPLNNATSGFYYTYAVGSWELTALTESDKYKPNSYGDGGTDPAMFESGTDLTLSPFAKNLASYWKLDEATGVNNNDSSGFANTGTPTNGPTSTSNCKSGSCLALNGINAYVSIPDKAYLKYTGGNITLSIWVNINSTETTGGHIISKPWNGSGEYNYRLIYTSSNIQLCLVGATTACISTSVTVPNNNTWHYVAATVNSAGSMKIYIDGAEKASGVNTISNWTPSSGDNNLPLAIGTLYPYGGGWAGNTGFSLDGYVDDVRIYTRALSATEINNIYSSTK